jgi:uncharacterized protein DUF1629
MARPFFIFNDMLEDSDVGFRLSQIWKLPRIPRTSWITGSPHRNPIPTPIEVELNPDFGTELLDSYHEFIPVWSDRLIALLRGTGVDTFDTYDAIIRDPRSGLVASDYRAVNVLGLVDCVDMARSTFDPRSEMGAREFTKLVIDPSKARDLKMFRLMEDPTLLIIDDDVRLAIEAGNLRGIRADPVESTPE